MKAYNYAMAMIFLNAGFAVVFAMGGFGSQFQEHTETWNVLSEIATFEFTVPFTDYAFPGVMALAGIFAVATAVIVGSQPISATGVSIVAFAGVFWGSFIMGFSVLYQIPLEGIGIFLLIFTLAAVLIFTITLIQIPTGGQKAYA